MYGTILALPLNFAAAAGKNESGVLVSTIPLQDVGSSVRGQVSVVMRYIPHFWT
jgi:hypothetical protein